MINQEKLIDDFLVFVSDAVDESEASTYGERNSSTSHL